MSIVPPPVQGFNNNVRHRGRVFHIQTEDSGVKSPRIVTHLFADGGRVIKTIRTEYSEHVTRPDMQAFVRGSMKDQHKAMFMALRLGELDALLETVCGPFEQPLRVNAHFPSPSSLPTSSAPEADATTPAPDPLLTERSPAPEQSESPPPHAPARHIAPTLRPGLTPTLASALGPASKAARTERSHELVSVRPRRKSNPPAGRAPRPSLAQGAAAAAASLSRPSARFAEPPSARTPSLFGEGLVSEQSLDEVILSYLAEDMEGGSE